MGGDVRATAREFLKGIPATDEVTSNGPRKALFTTLTGYDQAMLEAAWKVHKTRNLTTCNEFVGRFGAAIGSKHYMGTFWPLVPLEKAKKTEAWIKASGGGQPKFGDIFKLTEIRLPGKDYNRLHVGVSGDIEGDAWDTFESGQGGPTRGFDALKRCKRTFKREDVEGWVDIGILIDGVSGGAVPSLPMPGWLIGWWKVVWRSQTFYYEFNVGKRAIWTADPADMDPQRCARGRDFANVTVAQNGDITLVWNASGSREVFNNLGAPEGQMAGFWNDSERLAATKL